MYSPSTLRKLLLASIAIAGFVVPGIARAVRYYDVELIIFARTGSAQGQTEYWPDFTRLDTDRPGPVRQGSIPRPESA